MDCGRVMGVVHSTRGIYICSEPTPLCCRVLWTAQVRLDAQFASCGSLDGSNQL